MTSMFVFSLLLCRPVSARSRGPQLSLEAAWPSPQGHLDHCRQKAHSTSDHGHGQQWAWRQGACQVTLRPGDPHLTMRLRPGKGGAKGRGGKRGEGVLLALPHQHQHSSFSPKPGELGYRSAKKETLPDPFLPAAAGVWQDRCFCV